MSDPTVPTPPALSPDVQAIVDEANARAAAAEAQVAQLRGTGPSGEPMLPGDITSEMDLTGYWTGWRPPDSPDGDTGAPDELHTQWDRWSVDPHTGVVTGKIGPQAEQPPASPPPTDPATAAVEDQPPPTDPFVQQVTQGVQQ